MNNKFRNKLVLIVVLLALTLVVVLITTNTNRDGVAGTGDAFVNSLVTDNHMASYDMLSDDMKTVFTDELWRSWVEFTFQNQQGGTQRIEETVIEGGNVYSEEQMPTRLVYRFEIDDNTYDLPIIMAKNDAGDWKVQEIGSFTQQ